MIKQTERVIALCKQLEQFKTELFQVLGENRSEVALSHKQLREYFYIMKQVHLQLYHVDYTEAYGRGES